MSSCTTCHNAPLAGLKFNVVNQRAKRYFSQRKGIPDFRIYPTATENFLTYLQPVGRQNVPLLIVFINQERNVGRSASSQPIPPAASSTLPPTQAQKTKSPIWFAIFILAI